MGFYDRRIAKNGNIGELNLLAPIIEDSENITFVNVRGQTDNNDSSEINIGIGQRSIISSFLGNDEMVFGSYGFLDARMQPKFNGIGSQMCPGDKRLGA